MKLSDVFEKFADKVTQFTGSPMAFLLAFASVLLWLASGPVFHYSDTWELLINTVTTIITFLMVFLIQKSQNKESRAIQLKLNELIAASKQASNRLVNIETLTEEELKTLSVYYSTLAEETSKRVNIKESRSIEEAYEDAGEKLEK